VVRGLAALAGVIGGDRLEAALRRTSHDPPVPAAQGVHLTREQLLSHVWGYDFDPGSNVVDVYVGYLRRKLGSERFETVRGMGYRLKA